VGFPIPAQRLGRGLPGELSPGGRP
jgi:hypothetical protein